MSAEIDRATLRRAAVKEEGKDARALHVGEQLVELGFHRLAHAVRSYCFTHIADNATPVLEEAEGLIEVLNNHADYCPPPVD